MRGQETQNIGFHLGESKKQNNVLIGLVWSNRNVGLRETETVCVGRILLSNQMPSPISLGNTVLCT